MSGLHLAVLSKQLSIKIIQSGLDRRDGTILIEHHGRPGHFVVHKEDNLIYTEFLTDQGSNSIDAQNTSHDSFPVSRFLAPNECPN